MASIRSGRFYNNKWLKIYHNHCFQVKHEKISSIINRNSIVAGLVRYTSIWKTIFGNRFTNFGISEDCVENVFCRATNVSFLPSLKIIVILCGTNNTNKDPPYEIVQRLIAIGSFFKNQPSKLNIFICVIFPRDESFLINRLINNEVDDLLKFKCLVKSFHFINQSGGWSLNNGALDFSLFYLDGLNLANQFWKQLALISMQILTKIQYASIWMNVTSRYYDPQQPDVNLFTLQQMWWLLL